MLARRHPWRWLAWSLAGLNVLCLVASLGLAISDKETALATTDPFAVVVAFTIFVAVFTTVGALLATRHPTNAVGWILLSAGVWYALAGTFGLVAEHLLRRGTLPLWGAIVAWVSSWAWTASVGPGATFLLLLFPTGRLLSPRWRSAGYVAAAGIALIILSVALMPGPLDFTTTGACAEHCLNPVGLAGSQTVLALLGTVGEVLLVIGAASGIASLILRFRKAGRDERLQLRWLLFAVALFAVTVIVSVTIETVGRESETAVNVSNVLISIGLATIPVAIGIAVLRYRLYDIDLVINRTLVYGLLSVILSLCYFGAVTVLQQVLSPLTGSSNIAVAASTLAVAALFGPVRSNVQSFIDRRFYRRRYDATTTLAVFATRLRTQTDIEAVRTGVLSVVDDTLQPVRATVWLRPIPRVARPHRPPPAGRVL